MARNSHEDPRESPRRRGGSAWSGPEDVHHNLLVALEGPLSNLSHVVAALLFGLHLLHGLWSLPQTLGLSPYWVRQIRTLGWTLAGALALAFLAPSVAAFFGWL